MKSLLCKRLAACLCMKQSPAPSPEPCLVNYRHFSDGKNGDLRASSSETPGFESMEKQLQEIRDILETRVCDNLGTHVHNEQQRCEDDKENEMKHDWLLAAAVLDRICAITVTLLFIAGTVSLFILFRKHPQSSLSSFYRNHV